MDTRKIIVAGIGGAGCRVVDFISRTLEDAPSLAAVNTDAKALNETHATTKLQIGSELTRGMGAGSSPETGRRAAEEDSEMIRGLFTDASLVIVVAGLGCGTGTGATPVVLDLAREAGALTMCFVTMPFKFEGEQRKARADEGLLELKTKADIVVVVPNDRLFADSQESNLHKAFLKADEVLGYGVSAIWRLLTKPGYVKVSLADLKKIAENAGGTCTFAYGEGAGKGRTRQAIDSLLSSPMLDECKVLSGAGAVLLSLVGDAGMTLKEVGDIMDAVKTKTQEDAHIFMGTVIDDSWKNRISVTLIASEQWGAAEDEILSAERAKKDRNQGKGRKKREMRQITIEFTSGKSGRFKDAEPTILDGEDLDIPTFLRKNIPIEH